MGGEFFHLLDGFPMDLFGRVNAMDKQNTSIYFINRAILKVKENPRTKTLSFLGP
jgi:hypothetical protein